MGTLTGIIKAAISAALLNRTIREALINGLTRSMNWVMQPSTSSKIISFISGSMKSAPGNRPSLIQTLIKGAIGLALLRLAKRSRIVELAAFSSLGALLLDMLKTNQDRQGTGQRRQKDRIIEVDEYKVIEEEL